MSAYTYFIDNIAFRQIQPSTPLRFPTTAAIFRTFLASVGPNLERNNTILPYDVNNLSKRIGRMGKVPKQSTFAIGAIINRAVSQISDGGAYVNVGVWHGFTFLAGMIDNPNVRCIGVDNYTCGKDHATNPIFQRLTRHARNAFVRRFEKYRSDNHVFYEMDYVDYFNHVHQGPISVYLYDGAHAYEDQVRGLQLAEPFFTDDCIVIVDDCNSPAPRQGTLDFMASSPHSYRLVFDQQTSGNRHPTFWNGLMILRREPPAAASDGRSAQALAGGVRSA